MDAKSRANFINAVADGTTVPCPKCGRGNKPGSRFCAGCGAELEASAKADAAFAPVKEEAPAAAAPADGAAPASDVSDPDRRALSSLWRTVWDSRE